MRIASRARHGRTRVALLSAANTIAVAMASVLLTAAPAPQRGRPSPSPVVPPTAPAVVEPSPPALPAPQPINVAPPRAPAPQLASFESVRSDRDRCAMIVQWTGRIRSEGSALPGATPDWQLLFGEDFSSLTGQSYEQLTPKARKELYDKYFRKCEKDRLYLDAMRDYFSIVGSGLLNPNAVPPIVQALAQRRTSLQWALNRIASESQPLDSIESFERRRRDVDDLGQYAARFFERSYPGLWPSEQVWVVAEVRTRFSQAAVTWSEGTFAGLSRQAKITVDDVLRLRSIIEALPRTVVHLDPAARTSFTKSTLARFEKALVAAVNARVEIVRNTPATLDGATTSMPLVDQFYHHFRWFKQPAKVSTGIPADVREVLAELEDIGTRAVGDGEQAIAIERDRILRGALSQWNALVTSAPDLDGLKGAGEWLRSAFSDKERLSPLYRTYDQLIAEKAGLKTKGLTFESKFNDVFLGRFRILDINPYEVGTAGRRSLFEGYVIEFSEKCRAAIPPSEAAEIIDVITERDYLVTNTTRIRTGIIATREFAEVFANPSAADKQGSLGPYFIAMTMRFQMRAAVQMLTILADDIRGDMRVFLERHGCQSAVTERFAQNLLRVNRGRPPLPPMID